MTRQRRNALILGLGGLTLAGGAWLARSQGWPVSDAALGAATGAGAMLMLVGALTWWSPDACASATPTVQRRYRRAFVPAMAGYVAVLFASTWLLRRIDDPTWLRALVALAPVVPIALVLRAVVAFVRDTDELQRRIELESISIATALVSLGYLAGGFLQLAKVIAVPAGAAMIWVFPLVCMGYGIAKIVVARRYT